FGLAAVHYTPQQPYAALRITATDKSGASASRDFTFNGTAAEQTVLLRPDRPAYHVGETMALTILTTQASGTVYLD
ncbi:hypothetical protein, partial [Salmonella sp. SAL4431]|uniref:hypothetical protein n=1 Tax=Salmonella sp. SAL4431 TaxID=3159886 RepID=UPI00397D67B9